MSPTPTSTAPAGRPCLVNFTEEGSFWAGKTFKSFQEFQKLDKAKAFERIAQQVAADGWQGMNAQKDIGVITATQTVSYGRGKQAPLNVVLKSVDPDGLRIDVVFTTSGGLKVATKALQEQFCKLLESATK
jgi:hypothetical protein